MPNVLAMTGHFLAYAAGICFASVCSDLPLEDVTDRLNADHPTGTRSRWHKADDDFQGGTSNPCPCPAGAGRRHWLFVC